MFCNVKENKKVIRTLFYLGFFRKKYLDNSSGLVCRNSGWTLLEVMIVIVIIGILASLAIPNMMGAIEKRKAQSALFQIKGTLQEAQRNAIKMGKECKVTLKGTNDDFDPPSIVVNSDPEYINNWFNERGGFTEEYDYRDTLDKTDFDDESWRT